VRDQPAETTTRLTLDRFMAFARGTHLLAPYDVATHVHRHAQALGLRDPMVYLVDLQQKALIPMLPAEGPGSSERPSVLAVDSTLAGRAYQHVETLVQPLEEGPAGLGEVRMWVPVLDGAERLGVLAATLEQEPKADDEVSRRLSFFAGLVAEVLMTKAAYGDALVRLRRTAPMGLAAEIQWSLLPPLTFADENVSVAAALEPAYDVAGDSVDYAVDADAARFAVFDGMGHELASAQWVSLVVAAYRNARRTGLTLTQTARLIDEAVTTTLTGEGFVTGLLAELDTGTGVLSWVNAGHPPPLLLRQGRLVKTLELAPELPFGLGLEQHDPAGGPAGDVELHVGSEQLEPGDYLLLYTDGVVEARSPTGELFGVPRLIDLMVRNLAAGFPASETMRRAVAALLEHQATELVDDATMLLAQWRPEHPEDLLP
jgi:serine phosphatase RsbU (regulator of sigma subunit)